MKEPRSLFELPWSDGNEVFLATLAEIGLPTRIISAMNGDGIQLVGAFVQLTVAEISRRPNLGAKSVRGAIARLNDYGLNLGMYVPGWDDKLAQDARCALDRQLPQMLFERYGGRWSDHSSLEDELRDMLLEVETERNAEMLCLLYGFNEYGPTTLESAGEKYGLTRERVRQIAERAEKKLRTIWRPTTKLFRARDFIKNQEMKIFQVRQFSEDIVRLQICAGAFHIGGVLRGLEILGDRQDIERGVISGAEFFGTARCLSLLKELVLILRRETSSAGCTNIQRLALRIGMEMSEAESVRPLLLSIEEVCWLDEEKNWLLSRRPVRNRLENIARRIFSIAARVEMNELRSSLLRPTRVTFVPPPDVLSRFLKYSAIAETCGGYAIAKEDIREAEFGKNDTSLLLAFQALGSPLTREQLEDYCLDELGMNSNSFYVYLSYSPLVVKLATGVFGLVGKDVEVGRVEAMQEEIQSTQFETTHGWSKAGTLWYHFRADRPIINSGARPLPSFVQNMTSGEWTVHIAGGVKAGAAKVRNGFISGISTAFVALGASNGDFVQLDFKIEVRELLVRIVGSEPEEFYEEAPDEYDAEDQLDEEIEN